MSSLSQIIDDYMKIREDRLEIDKVSKELKSLEEKAKQKVYEALNEAGTDGASGTTHNVKKQQSVAYNVSDWQVFMDYVEKNRSFELLSKSVNRSAIQEMVDSGEEVPGVTPFIINKLSITKAK